MRKQLHWLVVVAVVVMVGGLADTVFARGVNRDVASQHIKNHDNGIFVNIEPGFEGDPGGGFWATGDISSGDDSAPESGGSNASGNTPGSRTAGRTVEWRDHGSIFLRTLVGFVLSPNQPVLVLSGR